jgi:hypothetical protein
LAMYQTAREYGTYPLRLDSAALLKTVGSRH